MREEILCRVDKGSHALIRPERADYQSDAASNTCIWEGAGRSIYLSIHPWFEHAPTGRDHAMPSRGEALISSQLRLVPS
jgi:hypothetical protein